MPGVVDANFTQCGGTLTITWTVASTDVCDRPVVMESVTIDVTPSPDPVIDVPALSDLSCGEADAFVAPDATFTNGESGVCEISGVVSPTVESNFDECGGTITITYTAPTGCDNNSVEEVVTIEVAPAPEPEITIPAITPLTCGEALGFVAPDASFSNGATGSCEISGTVPGIIESDFTQCGGTITVTWTVESADNCDRPAVVESVTIDVTPSTDPVIDVPALADVSCAEAANFVAPEATFSNGESGVCEISGVVTPTVEENFDECGGSITITYTAPTGCDNNSVEEVVTIDVAPAPVPEITIPEIAELTCADAQAFVAPDATFSNGETGTCGISGTVPGVIDANFTQCGGTITVTWTVESGDNCDRPAVVESVTIDVTPSPDPVIDVPALSDLSCGEAQAFDAPEATFSNGESGVCEISGVITPTVQENFDECGGTITITYIAPTGCDNNSVEEVVTIEVSPAPEPEITVPTIAELTCAEAASFVAPDATYSNEATGTCEISGTIPGVVDADFTQSVSYTHLTLPTKA